MRQTWLPAKFVNKLFIHYLIPIWYSTWCNVFIWYV